MATRKQIEQGLEDIGACWAVRSDKFCDANDPYEDQIEGRKTYHVHPDRTEPRQNAIKRFDNLDELWSWIDARKRAAASDDPFATVVWTEQGYDIA